MVGTIQGRRRYDVIVVGGGPSGSYSAFRLSSLGMKVLLIDRKVEVGSPVQCAGLVNSSIFDLPGLGSLKDRIVLKTIFGADLFSPSGYLLPLRGKDVKAFSIDRREFDKELLRLAAEAGSDVILGHNVTDIDVAGNEVNLQGMDCSFSSSLIIGADGPSSIVRRYAGLENPRETTPGISMECVVRSALVPKKKVGVFTGEKIARGFFAWAIPSFGETGIRLGLSALDGESMRSGLRALFTNPDLARFLSLERIDPEDISVISRIYGGVPMGSPKRLFEGNFLIIGDSAGMAKPTSGGGILPSLKAIDLLSSIIDEGGYEGSSTLDEFSDRWSKGYGKELSRSMILRRIIRQISDRDIDKAVKALGDEKKLEVINSTGDIDRPIPLAMKLLKMDPSMLWLVPQYLPLLRRLLK